MKWQQDDCAGMAAALSYHALFSLFPILLVILSVIGSLIGPDTDAFGYIQDGVERFLPPEVRDLVKATLIALYQRSAEAGMIGSGLLLFSASTVFAVLSRSVDKIWRLHSRIPESVSIRRTVLSLLVNQLLAFLLVFGTALLLLTSLIANIAIETILKLVATFRETFSFFEVDELQLLKGLEIGSSFLILALAACILYKILPSVQVGWGDVWLGAFLTALLLVGLQQLVSNSVIRIGSNFLSYGVIGSVMILLLWIFLSCQLFFAGCEFSYVYTHLFGSRRRRTLNFPRS